MATDDFRPLLALAPFKGVDYTRAGTTIEPGRGAQATNCNSKITDGALLPERGRVSFVDLSAHVTAISVITEVMLFYANASSIPGYLVGGITAGNFVIYLYVPSFNLIQQITAYAGANLTYDQAVQFGGVVYFNNGYRLFLNQPVALASYNWTLYFWQYPPPNAVANMLVSGSTAYSTGPVATTGTAPITTVGIPVTITPMDMTNIVDGNTIIIDSGAQQEWLVVSGTTGTTFNVTNQILHDTGFGIWGGVDEQTVYYVETKVTTMPDGTISETSVDLNQYATPPNSYNGAAGGSFNLNPSGSGSPIWSGTHTDGLPYTTNLYRQSTLQPTWQLVANLTGTGTFTDIAPNIALAGNVQLTPQRDAPPCVPGSYGVDSNSYNYGSLLIYKGRVWVYLIAQDVSTNNVSQVQLWYSKDGRAWEFDQLTQVMLLDTDVVNQYANPANNFSSTYDSLYGNDPLALGSIGTWLMAQSKRQTWSVLGDDSSTFVARLVFNIGIVARHSGTDANGGRYWLSENGPYFFDGSAPKYIGDAVRGLLTSNATTPALAIKDQQQACGFFSNMAWYLAFPTLGYTLPYYTLDGEWLGTLPYAPAAAAASSFTPAYPAMYVAGFAGVGLNEVVAARYGAPGMVDFWFVAPNSDLGTPQTFSWNSPRTHSGEPKYEKQYRFLTLDVPQDQYGSAIVRLAVDYQTVFTWTVTDLSKSTRPIQSIGAAAGGELRGFIGQLSVELTGLPNQPAPQIWGCTCWGKYPPDRALQMPV
jgi:hypothetical protein